MREPVVASWGGCRHNAGRKYRWNSGKTIAVRLPAALLDDVLRYARLLDGGYPNGLDVEAALSCDLKPATYASDLAVLLAQVTKERNELDKECDRLTALTGDLRLELDTLLEKSPPE